MSINFVGDFSDYLIKYARKGRFKGKATTLIIGSAPIVF